MNTERPENPERPTAEAESDGTAERTGARRPRTAVVAAFVAAAVLLLGGGGAWLASGAGRGDDGKGGTGTPGGRSAPPPLALDGWSSGGAAGIAPGEPDPYGVTYVAEGTLPDGPRSAPVYAPEGEVGRDAVARLAKALGVAGTPVSDGDGWRVGGREDGPVLRVTGSAGDWSYSRYAPGTDDCRKVSVCAQDPAHPAGDPVSAADARRAAAPVLKALGQDGARIDAGRAAGALRVVNADPVVGGLPTYGWTTGLTVDEHGTVTGGHGLLARPAKGAEYPVLSAARTLKLLNGAAPRPADGHRMGIGGCASPVPLKDRFEQPCGAGTPSSGGAARAGVEKAAFGLAAHSVGGRQELVPSWLFEVRGSAARGAFTVTYPAVDPAYLASPSSPPAPSDSASASASAPGGTEHPVTVEGYSARGRSLTVRFFGGVCADHRASAREQDGRVTVTVTERTRPGRVCVLIAKEYAKTVRLAAPLAGRTVVAADGGRVPEAGAGTLGTAG